MISGKFAILGDVHGNIDALQAVIEDARSQGVTSYFSVGDIVGYNACPAECINIIRSLECVTVRGNHDHYCAFDESLDDFHPLAAKVVDWTRRQLSPENISFLKALDLSRIVSGITLVHGTLDMPEKWGYVFDPLEAEANIVYQNTSLCFHGHTHIPVVYEKDGRVRAIPFCKMNLVMGRKYFVNVGSVGQPRDGDPRAAYAVFVPESREIELRRVKYDIACAQKRIRSAGLPERLAIRLELGK